MDKTGSDYFLLEGTTGSLTISAADEVARKFAMLIEGKCLGLGPTKAAEKYGYTKQRFFQLLDAFEQAGSSGLISKKKGPKTNYVRTENAVSQVIRYRFLDPDANAAVITQKMKQTGIKISQRSVERVIAEYGLQKKRSISFIPKTNRNRLKSSIPKNELKR
jgi:transposase